MTAAHGLVIGKFYPPHDGHRLLIRTAAAVCRRVTVVVMAATAETIPLDVRVGWLREIHAGDPSVTVVGVIDDIPMDFGDDAVWRAHVALMAQAARTVTAEPVDAVFTSEAYGAELGRRLHARHVLVDQSRTIVPISSTAVRTDPAAAWPHLSPCVRAYYTRRLVLVGAESTGKTTLADALTARLRSRGAAFGQTDWVPEFGREFTIEKWAAARAAAVLTDQPAPTMDEIVWTTAEFVAIAQVQRDLEDAAARTGGPVLICDTDAFATGVWHERYMHHRDADVEAFAAPAEPQRRLYLLTDPDDIPFVQDGIRDGFAIRRWMTTTFVERLAERDYRWQWLRGTQIEERLAHALELLDGWLDA